MTNNEDGTGAGKLLSICIAARNDNYGGNFKYRFETTLNHMARNARDLDVLDLVEIVVTDWNSEEKLGNAIHLSPEASRMTRFIYVPPETAAPYNPPGGCFNNTLTLNIALRRARGQFLLHMPSDILYSRASLKNLIMCLSGERKSPFDLSRTLILICRKFIPWQFIEREPDIDAIDAYLLHNSWQVRYAMPLPGFCGHIGAIIMSRGLYHEYRGYDEWLIRWGYSDSELGLRVNQKYPYAYLSHLGVDCYEMDIRPQARKTNENSENPWKNNPYFIKDFGRNSGNWGLGSEKLEIYRATASSRQMSTEKRKQPGKVELLKDMRDSTTTSLLVERFGETITANPEWPAIFLLGYCTHAFKPETYLDFGFGGSRTSIVPLSLYQCMSYVGIVDSNSPSAQDLPSISHMARQQLRFQGNFHIISGNRKSSIERLAAMDANAKYDLTYFPTRDFPDSHIEMIKAIMPYLSVTGAVIIKAVSTDELSNIESYINNNHGNALFLRSYHHKLGLLVNCGNQSSGRHDRLDSDTEEAYFNFVLSPRC